MLRMTLQIGLIVLVWQP